MPIYSPLQRQKGNFPCRPKITNKELQSYVLNIINKDIKS